MSIIEVQGISKSFGGKKFLFKNVNLSLEKGDFAFLTGKSGSGKSTFLKIIHHLERADCGSITLGSELIASKKNKKISIAFLRRRIGFVFQDYRLLENQTVARNIQLPLHIQGLSKKKINLETKKTAEDCGIVHLLQQNVHSLSGGEKQLVALARASIIKPAIILADEPTANLDNEASQKVLNLLYLLCDKKTTILIATHDLALISSRQAKIFLIQNQSIKKVQHG